MLASGPHAVASGSLSATFSLPGSNLFTSLLKLMMDFQTSGSIPTDSPMLLFTQYTTTWLAAVCSHCHAVLPAKMSECNSHMRQNAYYRNRLPYLEVNL